MINRSKSLRCSYKTWPKVITRHLTMDTDSYKPVELNQVSFTTSGQHSPKPPLIILHGFLSSLNLWKTIGSGIHQATGRTVIIVDARNHGSSPHSPQHTYIHMAHDIAELIKKLGHLKVSVLGHSMGGRTAMALSLLHPDMVSSMIVSDISPKETSDARKIHLNKYIDTLTRITRDINPRMTYPEAKEEAYTELRRIRADDRVRDFIADFLIQTDTGYDWRMNVPALKENIENITSFPNVFKGIKYLGPTFFIAGAVSDYISENDLGLIQEFFPSAELVFVERAGHTLPYDHPEKIIQLACKFLEK